MFFKHWSPLSFIFSNAFKCAKKAQGQEKERLVVAYHNVKAANRTYCSVGAVYICPYSLPGLPTIIVTFVIIPTDVPSLLVLDVFDAHELFVDFPFSLMTNWLVVVKEAEIVVWAHNSNAPLLHEHIKANVFVYFLLIQLIYFSYFHIFGYISYFPWIYEIHSFPRKFRPDKAIQRKKQYCMELRS